jgi:hypothetical protein
MTRTQISLSLAVLLVAAGLACSKGSAPAAPTPPPVTVTLAAPTAKSPVGGVEITGLRPTFEVNNSVATGEVGPVTYRFEFSETAEFPADSRTTALTAPQGAATTAVQVSVDLQPNTIYYWHARSTNGTVTSAYSATETVRTENRGFRSGQTVYDPLTNGQTVADERFGGTFVTGSNGGWQATGMSDSLDYNIPTCTSCVVEFDATNFDRSTSPADVDMKWFSMGDGSTFNNFNAFRDSIWKMHLEKKSLDGGSVKLIWRRGCNDSDGCDNTDNPKIPIAWEPAKVYHFTIAWGGGSMSVKICEWNGSACGATVYTAGGGGPYAPPNHRIELGTRPRGETLVGTRFRNVKIGPK